jgi:methionine synthase I (cobalamin-dependent)/5,10-methylenetetrahydrofolate reductase
MGSTAASAPLVQRLADGSLLADGAMGTMLYARGVPLDACFDVLNLHAPKIVQAIHQEYVGAGADLLETNTFGANRFKLAVHGLDGRVSDINRAGARLARDVRETMGRDVLVLGSMGPLGKYLLPLGTLAEEDARAAFREQAEALLEGGVDGLVVETFSDVRELRLAVAAIRGVSADVPVVAQMAFTEERLTFVGQTPAEVARELRGLPVQVIGANCGVGSSVLYDVLVLLHEAEPEAWLSIMPNAGLPSRLGERLIYLSSPAYMADWAGRMLEAGARIVGGCCGTTPAHTRAMREAVDRRTAGSARPARAVTVVAPAASAVEVPAAPPPPEPSRLLSRLRAGAFVVTVELDPPRGHNIEKLVQGAKLLVERGVEVVDINDGSLGRVRMAVLPTAMLVREATGLDINMHFTCRDRNLLGIQADLLGAHALGVRNILAMTGDPPRAGDYVNATAVFDVDAVGLVRIVAAMNRGADATGNSIGEPTAFGVGVALDPGAADPLREIDRFHAKVAAGAMWAQTQPVYDLERLDAFVARLGPLPVPLVVGILPLHSSRHAEFLHNEVPGVTIPDAMRARLRAAGDQALRVGIEAAQETLVEVRRRYAGAYLMPSFGRFEVVAEVLEALR